jgi:branched-chain amino acid transport system ATP-binding protein
MTKKIGDVILDVNNISLRFGGVKALTDISFNVREHEVRAIIGPNGLPAARGQHHVPRAKV